MPTPKRKSAFNQALEEAQRAATAEPQDRLAATPQNGSPSTEAVTPQNLKTVSPPVSPPKQEISSTETVKPQSSKTVERLEKVTFYITAEQLEKLDDLAHDHRKRTRRRINRNEIIRYLIESCTIEDLSSL